MATYAATTGVIRAVSRTMVVAWAIAADATQATAAGVARVLLGTDVVVSHICYLSHISTPADADGGGIMALSEGGTVGPSSSDKLDTYICVFGAKW